MKYKFILLSLIIIVFIIPFSYAQNNDTTVTIKKRWSSTYARIHNCIDDIRINIFDDSLDRNIRENEFQLYFRVNDSVFIFKHGDSFCLDSGKTKNVSLFFFYQNRMFSSNIDLTAPFFDNQIYIKYIPIEDIKPYPKKAAKEGQEWYKFYKKNKKYLYCEDDAIPIYFPVVEFMGKKLKLNDLYYGAFFFEIDGRYIYIMDRKKMW